MDYAQAIRLGVALVAVECQRAMLRERLLRACNGNVEQAERVFAVCERRKPWGAIRMVADE